MLTSVWKMFLKWICSPRLKQIECGFEFGFECESAPTDSNFECGSEFGFECESAATDSKYECGSKLGSECQGYSVRLSYIENIKHLWFICSDTAVKTVKNVLKCFSNTLKNDLKFRWS